jgi:hypothetical protein
MRGKVTARFLVPLCFVLYAIGARAQSPPIGAVVQTWHYDPRINIVTLQIVNTSHKDITGYNIAIKETYADGHVNNHELLSDSVGKLAFLQEAKGTANEARFRQQMGDGLFHPGETRNELISVAPNLKDFQAVVDVVAYADQTSQATNSDGLDRLLSHRKSEVASEQMANQIIKAALADPNDPDPAGSAAAKIQDRITLWKAQPHATLDLEAGTLRGVVDELRAISSHSTNKRDALNQYVAKHDQRIATLAPHAELKAGGPQ